MSVDLIRTLDDLAEAAAQAASRGIVSDRSIGPTLSRLTRAVRRRRAARSAGAGLLALALLGLTGGAAGGGWFTRMPVAAAPSPVADPVRTGLCGTTTRQLDALAAALPSLVVTNRTTSVVTSEDPFRFYVQASTSFVATQDSSVVLVRDGVVVGAGFVAEPVETGLSDAWDGPAVIYDCSRLDDVTRTTTGRYEMWLVSQVTLAGQAPARLARGPWEIQLSPGAAAPAPTAWPSPGP